MTRRPVSALFVAVFAAYFGASFAGDYQIDSPPSSESLAPSIAPKALKPSLPKFNGFSRSEVVDLWFTEYVPSEGITAGWTGSVDGCISGRVAPQFQDATLRRLNYFRRLAGIPGQVQFDETKSADCQRAALMMIAEGRNDHSPSPDFACYTPEGAEAASQSNLALGRIGPAAIDLWVDNPGDDNFHVGHRRWILFPMMGPMGHGSTTAIYDSYKGSSVLLIDPRFYEPRPEGLEYVTWPPKGHVPFQNVYSRWSFSYGVLPEEMDGLDFDKTIVSMKRDGTPIPLDVIGWDTWYGDPTIIWEPRDPVARGEVRPLTDVVFHVSLENVLVHGASKDFEYSVTVIDPYRVVPDGHLDIVDWVLDRDREAGNPDRNNDTLIDSADVFQALLAP